jgi:type II secretion system protein J
MRSRTVHNRGFTLAEVLIASTISAFVTLVAVGALKTITDGSQAVGRVAETTMELRFAARMMANDLANLYRDPDVKKMKLVASSQGSETGAPAFLTFYMAGRVKARAGQPEGDVYEVEYLLSTQKDLESEEPTQKSLLMRRLWPNPDRQRDPGGILSTVAEQVAVLEMNFFDGKQWSSEWPEEMQSIPQLIEVTLIAQRKGRGDPMRETFVVGFPRLAAKMASSPGEGQPEGQTPQPEGMPPEPEGGQNTQE